MKANSKSFYMSLSYLKRTTKRLMHIFQERMRFSTPFFAFLLKQIKNTTVQVYGL